MLTSFRSYDEISFLLTYNASQISSNSFTKPTYVFDNYSELLTKNITLSAGETTTIDVTNVVDNLGKTFTFNKLSYFQFKSINGNIRISSNISNFFINNNGVIVTDQTCITNNSSKLVQINGVIIIQNLDTTESNCRLITIGENILKPTPSPSATPAPTPTATPAYPLLWNSNFYLKWGSGPQDIIKWGPGPNPTPTPSATLTPTPTPTAGTPTPTPSPSPTPTPTVTPNHILANDTEYLLWTDGDNNAIDWK